MNMTEPLAEGLSKPVKEDIKSKVAVKPMRTSSAKSLQELSQDYGFFTAAILYGLVPLDGADPLNGFLREYEKPVTPYTMQFNRKIFEGLSFGGQGTQDYTLLAIEKEHFMPLLRWAKSLSFFDSRRNVLIQIRPQWVKVVDPLYLANAAVVTPNMTTVDVAVFALDTPTGSVWLQEQPGGLPKVVSTDEAYRDTQVFANALLQGDKNPLKRVEEDKLEPGCGLTASEAWLIQQYGNRTPAQVAGIKSFSELPKEEQEEIISLAKRYGEVF